MWRKKFNVIDRCHINAPAWINVINRKRSLKTQNLKANNGTFAFEEYQKASLTLQLLAVKNTKYQGPTMEILPFENTKKPKSTKEHFVFEEYKKNKAQQWELVYEE